MDYPQGRLSGDPSGVEKGATEEGDLGKQFQPLDEFTDPFRRLIDTSGEGIGKRLVVKSVINQRPINRDPETAITRCFDQRDIRTFGPQTLRPGLGLADGRGVVRRVGIHCDDDAGNHNNEYNDEYKECRNHPVVGLCRSAVLFHRGSLVVSILARFAIYHRQMPDTSTMILFSLASLVLVVVPGPAVIYILTRSISQGRSAGVASAFGVNAGTTVHVVAAVVGLSLIIANSATAFGAIKWAGVAYLFWLGFQTITADDTTFAEPQTEPLAIKRIFAQGVVVNVLNPKVAVFMLAFLPQFIDPSDPNATFQTFVLGMTLVAIGLVSDLVYALVGGRIGEVFRTRPGAARTTRRVAGVTYFALAGIAAITGTRA